MVRHKVTDLSVLAGALLNIDTFTFDINIEHSGIDKWQAKNHSLLDIESTDCIAN